MKKIIMAAAVGWTSGGSTAFKGCDYSIFVIGINEVSRVDQIKAIVADGGLATASTYAFYSGKVSANGAANLLEANSGKVIAYSGSGIDKYDSFIVYHDADNAMASHTATATIQMDIDATSKRLLFGHQGRNIANNMFDVAPEPSSALLMLLGMAIWKQVHKVPDKPPTIEFDGKK